MDEMMNEPESQARLKEISDAHGNPDPFAGGGRQDGDDNIA